MKNNNIFLSILLVFIFFFISNNTFAQSENKEKRLFVDFDIGAMIADATFMGHAAIGAGYRFNEKNGAGIELRSLSKFRSSSSFGLSGLGASYRYTDKWFLGRLSVGKVLRATRATDWGAEGIEWGEDWQYQKGGFYYSVSVAYRLRPGFVFGLSYTGVRNSQFDYYLKNIDTGELTFDEMKTADWGKVNFGTIGIMAGVALPGRGRK